MAAAISGLFVDGMDRGTALADGIVQTVALSQSIKMAWFDVVVNLVAEDVRRADDVVGSGICDGSADIAKELFERCPEHVHALLPAAHMQNLATRVHHRVYDMAEAFLKAVALPRHKLPQQWFRESAYMLKVDARKSGFVSVEEQISF